MCVRMLVSCTYIQQPRLFQVLFYTRACGSQAITTASRSTLYVSGCKSGAIICLVKLLPSTPDLSPRSVHVLP